MALLNKQSISNDLELENTINKNEKTIQIEEDNFRKIFKYLKSREQLSTMELKRISDREDYKYFPISIDLEIQSKVTCNHLQKLGLKPIAQWKLYKVKSGHPGLIIIRNSFTSVGILQWVQRCVQHYSELPNKTNLYDLNVCQSWWNEVSESLSKQELHNLTKKLRWATIGYHHNWNTKVYDFEESSPMPQAITNLCQLYLNAAGVNVGNDFKAEAVIVNYYPPGSTLSPHTDNSEPNNEAPLVSLSFGRSAIFLIGGLDKNVTPSPIYLHQGDVVIMSGKSRLCYHAVPRILNDADMLSFSETRGLKEFRDLLNTLIDFLDEQNQSKEKEVLLDLNKLSLDSENKRESFMDSVLRSIVTEDKSRPRSKDLIDVRILRALWTYIGSTRINMNIRQVHFESTLNKS